MQPSGKMIATRRPKGLWFVLVVPLLTTAARAQTLKAGVAETDITPPPGLPMYGYFGRIKNHEVSSGTLDPLYARVLVLAVGRERLGLVTLDLGRTFGEPSLDGLRAAARKTSRINYLIVTASHTHSGPNILDEYSGGRIPAWQSTMLDKITWAIHEAAKHLVPVRIGVGDGKAFIGYNRRHVNGDGSVTMLWSNPAKSPTQPVDPTLAVLRIDDMAGKPLAILTNYACHPVVFGGDNLQYSADYVGVALKAVADAFEGKPVCFFLQGAAGDINPYYAATPVNQGAVQKRDWTGRELGREAARVAQQIQTRVPSHPSLDFAEDVITFPLRWDPEAFRNALLKEGGPAVFEDHADLLAATPPPATLALHVTSLVVDKEIAFAGMPGEPFVDFQVTWRARCPARACFFLGYTNGYFDYFPTILAATQGGYGAADSDTYVAVGAAERMLNHAIVRVYEMLGELRTVPESRD